MFMRLKELHAVSTSPDLHLPFPPNQNDVNNDDLTDWADLSMRNAWFPGELGSVKFYSTFNPPPNSRLYTPPGQFRNVLCKVDGHPPPPPGAYPASPYTHEAHAWLYKQFDRKLDKERRKNAEADDDYEGGYRHEGWEHCERCREREKVVREARVLDERDHESISDTYAREWMAIDQLFQSVGLGSDETEPLDADMDDDATDAEDEDIAVDEDDANPEFIEDVNADVILGDGLAHRPIRRGTDREKIVECDGIQDIIFRGATDRRHALAWNKFAFYGRVRPWDGLIGILRRSPGDPQYWPRQNFIFMYGYLVNNETFIGNWRFAAHEPNLPTWESAFVMSRRKDEDGSGSEGEVEMVDDIRNGDW
ncbi:hypothetical protein NP233_g9038 [Leucocoprinus birnbaumii]|uniref:Uncharacterized protein n=1 Tax=Leucocoprinus birnbaumii TaxID=56174 RepID=A0AAD5YTA1_9AGAR|nr:hypothetical protein NP233_g9038 [Leucocoprinus birnbaumii]